MKQFCLAECSEICSNTVFNNYNNKQVQQEIYFIKCNRRRLQCYSWGFSIPVYYIIYNPGKRTINCSLPQLFSNFRRIYRFEAGEAVGILFYPSSNRPSSKIKTTPSPVPLGKVYFNFFGMILV